MKTIPLSELLAKATPGPIRTDCLPLLYVLVSNPKCKGPSLVNLWSAQVQPDNAILDREGCIEVAAYLAHAAKHIGPLVEALEAVAKYPGIRQYIGSDLADIALAALAAAKNVEVAHV